MLIETSSAIGTIISSFITLLQAVGIIDPSKAVKELHKTVIELDERYKSNAVQDIIRYEKEKLSPNPIMCQSLLKDAYRAICEIQGIFQSTKEICDDFNNSNNKISNLNDLDDNLKFQFRVNIRTLNAALKRQKDNILRIKDSKIPSLTSKIYLAKKLGEKLERKSVELDAFVRDDDAKIIRKYKNNIEKENAKSNPIKDYSLVQIKHRRLIMNPLMIDFMECVLDVSRFFQENLCESFWLELTKQM